MKWKFFKSARCVQVKLDNGEAIASLMELDQKLWTVLSASTDGLRFDPSTLKMLDSDGDGRIRIPEVLAAVEWLKVRFKNLDFLIAHKDEIAIADINEETSEGKALLESFKRILAREDRVASETISLTTVLGATKLFNAQPLNGDGIVTPKSTADKELSNLIEQIIATEGAVTDRSGEDGIDQTKADAFFADIATYLSWKADEKKHLLKLKDANADEFTRSACTETACRLYWKVKDVIDDYFKLPDDLPLVADDPTPRLSLTSGISPKWKSSFEFFSYLSAPVALGPGSQMTMTSITRDQWSKIKDALEPYREWLNDERRSVPVAKLDDAFLEDVVKDGKMQAAVNDLIARDKALADESDRFVDCERALRYAANLANWLCNYVNQANLYDTKSESVFRTGELYIDGRVCNLCFHVANAAAHSALAEKSKCCLLYVKLTRPGESVREVCAVVTAGSTASLYSGRNGIFYDCDGRDWDAVVTKVVESQVSLREAFWAPWAKIATTLSEQCKKFLSSKQDSAVKSVGDGAGAAVAASVPAAAAPAANGAALASSVAALGVGVGMAGAACAGLIGLVAGLPVWKLLMGVAAIILIVSLPSVVLAWFKLRARDLGAILNACGWAVNRPLYFSMGLARTFTRPAKMPAGAAVARDPYASHGCLKFVLVLILLSAIAVGVCWKMGYCPCFKSACNASVSATVVTEAK